jgi:hypothetical protein
MKIRLRDLRRIIREVLDQEAGVPGRFMGNVSGEDPSEEDMERLGNHGQRHPVDLEEDDEIVE